MTDWLKSILLYSPTGLLFFLGYLIRFRKAYWLISGYNTMSAEKKKNVDTAGLAVLMGNMCFAMGGIIFAGLFLINLNQFVAGMIVMGSLVPMIIWILIVAQKYDGNTRTESGKMKTSVKFILVLIITLLLLIAGFAGYSIYQSLQPITAVVEGDQLRIDGIYGMSIPLNSINEIELLEAIPQIQRRTNGSATGSLLRGHFQIEQIGSALLFIDKSKPPIIHLQTDTHEIFLNLETAKQTKDLYDTLKTHTE